MPLKQSTTDVAVVEAWAKSARSERSKKLRADSLVSVQSARTFEEDITKAEARAKAKALKEAQRQRALRGKRERMDALLDPHSKVEGDSGHYTRIVRKKKPVVAARHLPQYDSEFEEEEHLESGSSAAKEWFAACSKRRSTRTLSESMLDSPALVAMTGPFSRVVEGHSAAIGSSKYYPLRGDHSLHSALKRLSSRTSQKMKAATAKAVDSEVKAKPKAKSEADSGLSASSASYVSPVISSVLHGGSSITRSHPHSALLPDSSGHCSGAPVSALSERQSSGRRSARSISSPDLRELETQPTLWSGAVADRYEGARFEVESDEEDSSSGSALYSQIAIMQSIAEINSMAGDGSSLQSHTSSVLTSIDGVATVGYYAHSGSAAPLGPGFVGEDEEDDYFYEEEHVYCDEENEEDPVGGRLFSTPKGPPPSVAFAKDSERHLDSSSPRKKAVSTSPKKSSMLSGILSPALAKRVKSKFTRSKSKRKGKKRRSKTCSEFGGDVVIKKKSAVYESSARLQPVAGTTAMGTKAAVVSASVLEQRQSDADDIGAHHIGIGTVVHADDSGVHVDKRIGHDDVGFGTSEAQVVDFGDIGVGVGIGIVERQRGFSSPEPIPDVPCLPPSLRMDTSSSMALDSAKLLPRVAVNETNVHRDALLVVASHSIAAAKDRCSMAHCLQRAMTRMFPFYMIGPLSKKDMELVVLSAMGSAKSERKKRQLRSSKSSSDFSVTGTSAHGSGGGKELVPDIVEEEESKYEVGEAGVCVDDDDLQWFCDYKFCESTVHGVPGHYPTKCWISEVHGFDYTLCDTCVQLYINKDSLALIDSTAIIQPPKSDFSPAKGKKKVPPPMVSKSKSSQSSVKSRSVLHLFRAADKALDTGAVDKNVHSGWLFKRGAYRKGFKMRFCVLQSDKRLYYYQTPKASRERGVADLAQTTQIRVVSDIDFVIVTPKRKWFMKAIDRAECVEWLSALRTLLGVQTYVKVDSSGKRLRF